MKIAISVLSLIAVSSHVFSQQNIFPIKGDYIYYEFSEQTNNSRYCLTHYSSMLDSNGQHNPSAMNFMTNVTSKCQNINNTEIKLTGLKNTLVTFFVQASASLPHSCGGEIGTPSSLTMILPTAASLLEGNLLFSLFTSGKFKVSSQIITASTKVKFDSWNKYTLIFYNIRVKYFGTKGNKAVSEEINMEDLYSLTQKNESSNRMYNKGITTMVEVDRIIRACAKTYSEELKRVYELDEL